MTSTAPLLLALACLASSPAALGDVIVVDDSGGGDFTYVQAAIDAASEGDTLLVRPGLYADFFLDGKGLCIVAETPGTALFTGGAVIEGLAAGQRALLSGLDLQGNPDALEEGLLIQDCAGFVRVEACALAGAHGWDFSSAPAGFDGARVESSAAVVFVASTLAGGAGGLGSSPCASPAAPLRGGSGLSVVASNVSLYHCQLAGGAGSSPAGDCLRGGDGGRGVEASLGSALFAAGCEVTGGQGGLMLSACGCGGDGGVGLALNGAAAQLLDVALVPGAPDPSSLLGVPGAPTLLSGGATLASLSGDAPALVAPAAVTAGAPLALAIQGEPGDIAVLAASAGPGYLPALALQGTLLIGFPPPVAVALGAIGGTGELAAGFTAPALPPGVEAQTVFAQAVTVDALGAITLTGSRAISVLAPGLLP